MSDDERCLHDMLPGTCTLCQERAIPRHTVTDVTPGTFRRGSTTQQRVSAREHEDSTTMAARYPGFCRSCDNEIEIGDSISRNDSNEWVHSECL